ncbi:MAG: winged helix-turn-helix transcriptional regulator [Clostridia bacterium]|nr:winged helix-turn-helix transcriptional regulator [Clostridia bacterium]
MFNQNKSRFIALDEKTQKEIYYYMPQEKTIRQLTDFFSVFSDMTRLKILICLAVSELCVNDIANILRMNQTTISHQLKILRDNGALVTRRDGKVIYYSISDELINECMLKGVNFVKQGH